MKIGARTFKTGVAIFLSLLIPATFGMPEAATLAGISVITSMQPSVKKSFHTLRDRVFANTIGGIVAVIIASLFGNSLVMIGLASATLIALLHQLKLNNVIVLSTVTLIVIMRAPQENLLYSASTRVLATIIGVFIAFGVNSFILPPKYDERLYHLTNQVTDDLTRFIRASLRKNVQYAVMRNDLKHINQSVSKMKKYLTHVQDGELRRFFMKKEYSLARLIVVYRQFIKTTETAYRLIEIFHQSENVVNHFPEELRLLIRERLDTLMTAHEQILLKWNDRILPDEVNFIAYRSNLRKIFMEAFFNEASMESYKQNDYNQSNTVIHIMSIVLEYEESLQHLNTLVTSFKKHHQEDGPNLNQLHE